MNVSIIDAEGKNVGTRAVFSAWDARRVSPALLHQVAVSTLTNQRVFRAHTKDRAERRGGGRKPWKQKGTGRARHASIRSPLWRKGGVTFGPRADRTYWKRIPQGMKQVALAGAIVGKLRDEEIIVLDRLPGLSGKTSELVSILGRLPIKGSILLLASGDASVRASYRRAGRNLQDVTIADPSTVDIAQLLTHHFIVTSADGLTALESRVGSSATQP